MAMKIGQMCNDEHFRAIFRQAKIDYLDAFMSLRKLDATENEMLCVQHAMLSYFIDRLGEAGYQLIRLPPESERTATVYDEMASITEGDLVRMTERLKLLRTRTIKGHICGCQGIMPSHYVGMVARCPTCNGWKPAKVTLGNDDLPTPTLVKRDDQA